MLKKTKVKIMCDDELINVYSKRTGGHGSWGNPVEIIPVSGDLITINQGRDIDKTYLVKSRHFISTAKSEGIFGEMEIILNVTPI